MADSIVDVVLEEGRDKMGKATRHTQDSFAGVRSGRATPALVEKIPVEYFGSAVPLRQLAAFSVPEARLLVVTPYDKSAIAAIEKALMASDLGITPSNDGQVVRLAFPTLSAERRQELVRVVRNKAEEGRVSVRNIRRAARHDLEELEKGGEISEGELDRAEKQLEKLTHESIEEIDRHLAHKEQELLEA